MKTYTTKIAKNGATLYYSVETSKRIAKETALENERNYIIANGTAAERYELAKEEYRINEHGKIEKLGYHRVIRTCRGGYYYDEKFEWHTVNDSSADTDLQKDYDLTLEQFRAEVEAENAIEAKREKIISTPLVTAEAMEVAVDAEIELANATAEADPAVKAEFEAIEKATELARNFSRETQELLTAKADVDTLSTTQAAYEQARAEINKEITTWGRAVDDMTKDTTDYYTEREILIDGLLEAEDKALAAKKAIYKQALLTALIEKFSKNEADETIKEETKMTNETKIANELPKGEITTDSVKAAELIAAYFPNGLHFCGASKGYNKEDVFTFTDDKEKFYAIMYSTPDNSRIELIEVIKSYESGSKRRPFTVIIDNMTAEEVTIEDDGSNDDADEIFTVNAMPAEEDDNDDELVDDPNDYLYEINGHPVSNAEYVEFCESIIADLTPKRAYYWQAMQEAANDDDHDAWLHEYCNADETIQECIADIAKITGKEIVDDKSYPDDETPEPAAAEPVDEFTAELERLKAEREAAGKALAEKISARRAAEEALRKAEEEERAAEDKSHEANCAVRKFFTRKGKELTDKIWEFTPTAEKLTITTQTGKTFHNNLTNISVNGSEQFGFRFECDWKDYATYDTPAQVEQVIAMIKAAIARGDKQFTFPTIEQLNAPKIPPVKADIRDSLARAMKIALLKTQDFCREHNLKAAQDELGRYNICSAAMRELRKAVA